MSQLDLALTADVSTRHLSCIETGKTQPSREMITRLADTLELPLREHNMLLTAAGYAPKYPETRLDTPELAQMRHAIDLILDHQEPYPAFLLNRRWDIVQANQAAARFAALMPRVRIDPHQNMLHRFFDPDDLRAYVANWEEVASDLIRHLHNEVAAAPTDAGLRGLLDEVLGYPGVPQRWRTRELDRAPSPLLTVVFNQGVRKLRFFSTITVFGTPRDVTLDELRIECAFPADDSTKEFCCASLRG